jgi:hypothetical protein
VITNTRLVLTLRKRGKALEQKASIITKMTIIFTSSYFLNVVNSFVKVIWKYEDNQYIIDNYFIGNMYKYLNSMIWDFPAILSTVYLNHELIKQLEDEKEEKEKAKEKERV